MKRSATLLLIAAFAFTGTAKSQSKLSQKLLQPPASIVVNGNLKNRGDSLRYHNDDKNINYTLSNDVENLYAAIRISDRLE
ncbi:hypothetical protein NAF17_17435 [Mucilaginibacter sp. RB4R14]|uniref:hypothetical protein n=1 Tax=Mucilaginibacter aurantiaciroseus TaxID=2949308 RepID=UPI002091085B|nr:hypothetical protein [Mucilaginibacter aurantiaciroseus]MCO5937333.1 hypothetical protein [Mucilaginibacter aurantiaciroseus]